MYECQWVCMLNGGCRKWAEHALMIHAAYVGDHVITQITVTGWEAWWPHRKNLFEFGSLCLDALQISTKWQQCKYPPPQILNSKIMSLVLQTLRDCCPDIHVAKTVKDLESVNSLSGGVALKAEMRAKKVPVFSLLTQEPAKPNRQAVMRFIGQLHCTVTDRPFTRGLTGHSS